MNSCILSKFYIKPQLRQARTADGRGCILSKFYIKPQLRLSVCIMCGVVSYRNSTSNHNHEGIKDRVHAVVSYRNSTSNHNTRADTIQSS